MGNTIGVTAKVQFPMDDIKDSWNTGYGIGAFMVRNLGSGKLSLTGELSYSVFSGKEIISGIDVPDLNVWQVSAGLRMHLGSSPFYIGAEGAYFFNSLSEDDDDGGSSFDNEPGLLPMIGFRRGWLDLGVQYKVGGDVKFVAVRGAFGFF
jgi:hypothetical protein